MSFVACSVDKSISEIWNWCVNCESPRHFTVTAKTNETAKNNCISSLKFYVSTFPFHVKRFRSAIYKNIELISPSYQKIQSTQALNQSKQNFADLLLPKNQQRSFRKLGNKQLNSNGNVQSLTRNLSNLPQQLCETTSRTISRLKIIFYILQAWFCPRMVQHVAAQFANSCRVYNFFTWCYFSLVKS